MNAAISILALSGLVPAGIALALWPAARRFLPHDLSQRHRAPLAFGAAFFAGYALLPQWAAMVPARHWQWLPYLCAAAAVAGPIGLAAGVATIERWLLRALLSMTAALVLVPTWSKLEASRPFYVAALAGYFLALTVLLEPLPARLRGKLLLPLLVSVTGCVAAVVGSELSLKYGQIGLIAAAALGGCAIAERFDATAGAAGGALSAFAVVAGGLAFVGAIEPEPPLTGVLLIPLAPLALWVCAMGPLVRLQGKWQALVQCAAVLVPVLVGLVMVALRERPEPYDGY